MTGNIKLVPFGIENEESEYRIHICYLEGYGYLFARENAIWQIHHFPYDNMPVFSSLRDGSKYISARGYKVPPMNIENCQRIKIPKDISDKNPIWLRDSTTVKGMRAEKIARDMYERGLIIIRPDINEANVNEQIKGKNFISKSYALQVKCDYRGGVDGTGFLYIQVEECNPYNAH
ncbi:hypothetical protein ES705_04973 [subsurface metagenome]|jgi:hypothetical protein